jgi:hypothetical protein
MRWVPALVIAVVVAASCVPWLRHQSFFSVLIGITAVALFAFIVFTSIHTLSAWLLRWQSVPSQSRWRLLISRKKLWGCGIFIVLILTVPHYVAVCGGDYKLAVATAHQSRQFNELLGTPVKEGWYSEGKKDVGRGTLEEPVRSEMLIPVRGKRQEGNLRLQAIKIDGVWKLTELTLEIDNSGAPVDLLVK